MIAHKHYCAIDGADPGAVPFATHFVYGIARPRLPAARDYYARPEVEASVNLPSKKNSLAVLTRASKFFGEGFMKMIAR